MDYWRGKHIRVQTVFLYLSGSSHVASFPGLGAKEDLGMRLERTRIQDSITKSCEVARWDYARISCIF